MDAPRLRFRPIRGRAGESTRAAKPCAPYPFRRPMGNANVPVMPGLHSAHITSRLAPRLGGGGTIDPLLVGLSKPAQIVPMGASVSQIVDLAGLAAYQAVGE